MSTAVRLSGEALRPFLHPIHHQESWRLDLFIKGVHCSHCVYKIEKALKEKSQVPSYQFQAGGEKLSLWSQDPGHFSEAIDQIHQLGFSAIPISEKQNWQLLEEQDYKLALKRLAVAGVCAGNIMLFSIAVYLGADQGFTQFFHKLSFFLILPSLTYSAWPIWKGFMKGILNFRFNLDIPIGLALLTGFVLSSISLLGSQTQIYYDSLSVVIFLVLSSRFVLSRYVNRIYQKNIIHSVPGVYQARRILSDETQQMVPPESLKPGDWVQVERGEVLPVDGKLLSPRAIVDNSILTGESSPVVYKIGRAHV